MGFAYQDPRLTALEMAGTELVWGGCEDRCSPPVPSSSTFSLSSFSHSHEYEHEHKSWHTHPILSFILQSCYDASSSTWDPLEDPVKIYIDRIREISESNDRAQISMLLAHAYVRYMGDLSGGQFIRRRIAKAFDLQAGDEGVDGVKFYDFPLFDPNPQSESEVDANANAYAKRIKSHFRTSLDAGFSSFVEDNDLSELEAEACKLSLINEANLAFELSGGLFDLIHAPDPSFSSSDSSLSSESDLSLTPVQSPSASSHQSNTDSHISILSLTKLSLPPIISSIYSSFAFNNVSAGVYTIPACIIIAGFAISVQVLSWMYQ